MPQLNNTLYLLSAAVLAMPLVSRLHSAEVRVNYQPSDAVIANPERGFYVQRTAKSEGRPLTDRSLLRLRKRGITLVLRMYYLESFRNKPFSAAQLNLLKQDFSALRRCGCKCIVRFAYSSRIGEADAPMDIILEHIDQLEPILRDNMDVIAVVQAGFIGAWGELHNSSNHLDDSASICRLVNRLLEAVPSSRNVQVRTPKQKLSCLSGNQPVNAAAAFANTTRARIGHYNDCFLSNETDVGTYDKQQMEQQKRYLALDTRYVSMGGETCRLSAFAAIGNARKELARFHWTYLHLDYHPEVIAQWRSQKFLKEVEQNLGYRLSLISSHCDSEVSKTGGLTLTLRLQNTGWAAPINPRDVMLIAKHEEMGNEYQAKLPVDPRYWLPGRQIEVTNSIGILEEMPLGKYHLFLWLPDPEPKLSHRSEFAIQLANRDIWDATTARHGLNQTMHVSARAAELDVTPAIQFERTPSTTAFE